MQIHAGTSSARQPAAFSLSGRAGLSRHGTLCDGGSLRPICQRAITMAGGILGSEFQSLLATDSPDQRDPGTLHLASILSNRGDLEKLIGAHLTSLVARVAEAASLAPNGRLPRSLSKNIR